LFFRTGRNDYRLDAAQSRYGDQTCAEHADDDLDGSPRKVVSNLMVDVKPTNEKLRARAAVLSRL